jgi:uracil-DNA glycosylase
MSRRQGLEADLTLNLFDTEPPSATPALTAWQPRVWHVASDWQPLVNTFFSSLAGLQLATFVEQRLAAGACIYPAQPLRALELTALRDVRVVILGQDPYHGAGQAEGLAFSVARGAKLPPSLRNIFKERQRDLGLPIPSHGSLQAWAAQGVLLLNTSLTVEDGQPASHAQRGWETLTDNVIQACAQTTLPVVFMLWGGHAQAKQALIAAHNADARHLVLKANHPSPLSALRPPLPFIGSGHFGAARGWLAQDGKGVANTLFI